MRLVSRGLKLWNTSANTAHEHPGVRFLGDCEVHRGSWIPTAWHENLCLTAPNQGVSMQLSSPCHSLVGTKSHLVVILICMSLSINLSSA